MRPNRLALLGLIAVVAGVPACGKKKHNSTTDSTAATGVAGAGGGGAAASTVTSVDGAVVTAPTASLALSSSLDVVALGGGTAKAALALADVGGDYAAARTHLHVEDDALSPLDNIGMILCFLSQTGYNNEKTVNTGNYLAQVDMGKCDGNHGGGDNGGQSGSGKQVKLVNVVVNSSRPANQPLDAKIWFDQKDGRYVIRMLIAEGVSDANPYGIWRMEFKGYQSAGGVIGTTPTETGVMEAKRATVGGDVLITMYDATTRSDGSDTLAAAVQAHFDGGQVNGGWASIDDNFNFSQGGGQPNRVGHPRYQLAWSQGKFEAYDQTAQKPICKDLTNYSANIWRYGVYDANGKAVALKGSIPIKIVTIDSASHHGNASSYGVWMDDGVNPANIKGITNETFGNAATPIVNYTLVSGPGKLTKHTRVAKTLDDVDGVELEGWSQSGQNRIVYSKATHAFTLTGKASGNGQGGPQWADVTPPTAYTLQPHVNFFYSQGLGGQVAITADAAGTAQSVSVIQDSDVTGSAGALHLNCFSQCLKGNIDQTSATNNAANQDSGPQTGSLAAPFGYTFDQPSYTLKTDAALPVIFAAGVTVNGWGMSTGNMIDDTALAAMRNAGSNAWDMWTQPVTYSWQLGSDSNPWNRFQALKDASGKVVTFDQPLFINYTHSQANDFTGAAASPFYGKKFRLQYAGDGQLQVPGKQDADNHWVSEFAIKAGATSDDGAYVIKPLDGVEYMLKIDNSVCVAAGLDSTKAPALPLASSFIDDAAHANLDAMPDATGLAPVINQGDYVGP